MYKIYKVSREYEGYLNIINMRLRYYFTICCLSLHPLRIQTGRYNNIMIERSERYCVFCNYNEIEDEYQFICLCPLYNQIRKKYILRKYYVNPSVYKFHALLQSCNREELLPLCLYVNEALKIRNSQFINM